MIWISSNHASFDRQVSDSISYIRNNGYDYESFMSAFPEWENITWSGEWVDTIHDEYTSWVADWLENNTNITWWEGEPCIPESKSDYELIAS